MKRRNEGKKKPAKEGAGLCLVSRCAIGGGFHTHEFRIAECVTDLPLI